MPSRVIRERLVSSYSLSTVSVGAELTFVHLLLIVDDFGRCDGRLSVLRAALFPTRDVPFDQLDGWLGELDQARCIQRYEADARKYLVLPNWESHFSKQKRAQSSKHPDPPELSPEIPGDPGDSALVLGVRCLVLGDENPPLIPPQQQPSPAKVAPTPRRDWRREVRGIWPECQKAAESHGAHWRDLSDSRVDLMAARLKERAREPPEILVHAIHGAMASWGKPSADWDPVKRLRPKTIYARSNFTEYLEAYKEPSGDDGKIQAVYRAADEHRRRQRDQEAPGELEAPPGGGKAPHGS